MSKVIKSSSVYIESLKIITHDEPEIQTEGPLDYDSCETIGSGEVQFNEELSDETEGSVGGSAEDAVDLNSVREQAAEILQETEQMVRELLETARQEAQKIIQKANEEADAIISSGNEQVREVHEAAFTKGREEGYQYGLKIAEDESVARIMEAEKLVEQARQERVEIIEGSENEILQLAMAVARKVVGEEIVLNSECVVDIVKKAIQKATDRQELTVRVNPENLDVTLNAEEEINKSAAGIRKMRVTADPAVSIGGCVVETPNETVDARVERQLDEIEQALLEVGPYD
ncbi:MAG TPA: FliH/SctL family protein [Desulfobacteria bacterium]|nr:FliH/SctL family protein [Desulfobacteria bacterium]